MNKHKNMNHMNMNSGSKSSMNMNMSSDSQNSMKMKMSNGDMMMHGGQMMHMGNLKQKFWVSLVLMIPILLLTSFMGIYKTPITFPGSKWVVAVIGTFLFFYGGYPFFSGAKGELKSKKPAMMTLITMGISVAYVYSIYSVIANNIFHVSPAIMDFFSELATLIVIMLLGHWLEMNAVMNAGSAVNKLAKLLPNIAHLIKKNNSVEDISVSDLKIGEILQVRAGEQVPADGIIIRGKSNINESLVTGESKNVRKKVRDQVIGGTINGNGSFDFKVKGTGKTGYLAKVTKLVQEAQNNKSKSEGTADKVAGYLFYAASIIAIISFIAWLITEDLRFALSMAVTVLVIACPHALGLAIPLVTSRSTSLAATNGLLVRNKTALEKIKNIRYILMDKTGTLTEGKFKVNKIESLAKEYRNKDILKLMASLESQSTHPLATGILTAAKKEKVHFPSPHNVKQINGVGIKGEIKNNIYLIVSLSYLQKKKINYPKKIVQNLTNKANTVSFLIQQNKKVIGLIAQGDKIKSESYQMIKELKDQGLIPVMLTGDNKATADKVGQQLDVNVQAELLPEDKQKKVEDYQNKGKVMFVGDGINDAPSLTKADIGVAIGSGTDVAVASADAVLVKSDPEDIIKLITLEKRTKNKVTENLWWGAGYNIIALPLAAGILAPIGFILNPTVGAIVMSLSTIIVALNAMTLHLSSVNRK